MQWLEDNFFNYFDMWEQEVENSASPATERRKMMLSTETIEGIRITGIHKDALMFEEIL